MTKSPIEQAREYFSMKPGATWTEEGVEKLQALIEYAESLERKNRELLEAGVFDKSKIKQLNRQVKSLENLLLNPGASPKLLGKKTGE